MTAVSFPDVSPIFVVGAARSGTTLLQLMLNAHPNIAMQGELHFFDQTLQIRDRIPDLSSREDCEQFFSLLRTTDHFQYLPQAEHIYSAVQEKMSQQSESSYEDFYCLALKQYAQVEGAARFGEKTPSNVRYLDSLLRIFPRAKIVHICRDPRAVVASSIKIEGDSPDVLIHTLTWRCDIAFRKDLTRNEEIILDVQYEQLVSEPEAQLRRVCDFVGEEFRTEMLEFFSSSDKYLKNEPWKDVAKQPVSEASIAKWRNVLTPEQIVLVERLAGRSMEELGYSHYAASRLARLALPGSFLSELGKYLVHRYRKRAVRQAERPDMIHSDRSLLYRRIFTELSPLERKRQGSRTGA